MTCITVQNNGTGFFEVFKNVSAVVRCFKDMNVGFPVHQLKREKLRIDEPIIKKKVWIITRKLIRTE